ncbi:hypothetical protein E2562_038548 [Oryza meyeriana var. granulata]|uniref:Uncharacterized protein n=1 Tax=Oryza meyeriana var. granulata TaxID=110450 RepID=A0A6G1F2B2_9ORYZ|nr:hypothetical protein E2562_038548 [Oryza meyeriana var. granulata]
MATFTIPRNISSADESSSTRLIGCLTLTVSDQFLPNLIHNRIKEFIFHGKIIHIIKVIDVLDFKIFIDSQGVFCVSFKVSLNHEVFYCSFKVNAIFAFKTGLPLPLTPPVQGKEPPEFKEAPEGNDLRGKKPPEDKDLKGKEPSVGKEPPEGRGPEWKGAKASSRW